ncbi:MAG: type I pullulanase [Bacteroidales bacterium]
MKYKLIILLTTSFMISCSQKKTEYTGYEEYPTPVLSNLWLHYSKEDTEFKLWSPLAEKVQLNLYEKGEGGKAFDTQQLNAGQDGLWERRVEGDLHGTYYTYQVQIAGKWLAETPGIYAQAVGVNGIRAMVLDLESTNPPGWNNDKGPDIKHTNEAIIYELHVRDITIHPESGSSKPGTFLGLVEEGTTGPGGITTGFDHIKEMGITHVHLLPSFDFSYIDETKLDSAQFNWGYMPRNYHVPDGSFSTDPWNAEVRIREFKEMVQIFHKYGLGVILDVVYNHSDNVENSNFNLEVPGYYYRTWENGNLSNASGCGNETASERAMMRKFMLESVAYWAKEYHVDGFRFDLMGVHDISTMNEIAKTLKEINPTIFVYGEGWSAGDSPLPFEQRAVKQHIPEMPQITAFSDEIRDGLKGSVFDDKSTGFVSGAANTEESIKFGVVGGIQHPQIDYKAVNYSDAPWTNEPWQAISYVSCHDNHTLYDKLRVSRPDASEEEVIAMDKLAQAVVMTSQGTAFIHAGAEMLRTKKGEHNSYNLPDSINQIDWKWKVLNSNVVEYYKNLISLRKQHPAFRMNSGREVVDNIAFKTTENGLVSYQISNHANGDKWKNIYVIYNAKTTPVSYKLDGEWQFAVYGDDFHFDKGKNVIGSIDIPAISMAILFQEN